MGDIDQIGGGVQEPGGIVQIEPPLAAATGDTPPPDPPAGSANTFRPTFRGRRR